MGPALLIAHGVPDDAFHDRAFARLGRAAPRVAYLGAANGDQAAWYGRIAQALERRHGARVQLVRTIGVDDPAPARAALAAADLIYLSGGDVKVAAERLRALGLDADIRACHAAGATVLGVSAGAIALTRFWIDFPDGAPTVRFPCIGALDLAVDCHDEESDWEELRALLARWAADEPAARVEAWGIPSGGALEIVDGAVGSLGPAAKHLRLDGGRVLE